MLYIKSTYSCKPCFIFCQLNHYLLHFFSDSESSAQREIQFFFPDFRSDDWYRDEEECFRSGRVIYDENEGIHSFKMESSANDDSLDKHVCFEAS